MDWIQFPFEVDARVHLGAGAPLVRQRWMFTDQPFLPVGTQCVLMNRIWDQDQISDLSVGMLPPGFNNYVQDARWKLPAALKPGHMCHPEWLSTGEPWPNDLPPTVYGASGIPECCGLFQDGTEGGVQLGGSAGDDRPGYDPTEGGVQLGGSAGDSLTYRDPTEGGVQVGGEAGDIPPMHDATEGGVQLGGSAGDDRPAHDPTEGGVQLGGSAGDSLTYRDPTEGGVQVGGSAGDVPPMHDATEGGVQVGGEAGDHWSDGDHGTCPTALDLGTGGTFSLDFPAGPAERWVRWNPPLVEVAWHVETGLPGFDGVTIVPYQGDDCDSLGEKVVLVTSLVCVSFFLDEVKPAFVKFVSDLEEPRTQLFTVDAGNCGH